MDRHFEFSRLMGDWTLIRQVPGHASMVGEAKITPLGNDTAQYAESVRVLLKNGESLHGEQRYLYRRSSTGFDIFFHETRQLFHSLTFAVDEDGWWRANARHDCKADSYFSEYRIGPDGEFHVRHVVRGPQKNYVIVTSYSRMPVQPGMVNLRDYGV